MNKVTAFLKGELEGWKLWEIIYILSCTAAICGISISLGDTLPGICSAVAGTLYTMLAGKGKVSCYFFGIINTILYGYIARQNRIYGDMMLNWFIYLPMMFAGIYLWIYRLDTENTVIKEQLSLHGRILVVLFCTAAIAGYAVVLKKMNGAQPVIDAATTVLSVMAMVLTLKRCVEQWLLWTAVNLLSTVMWVRVWLASGGESSVATLLWWLIMLVSGIIFFIQWCSQLGGIPKSDNKIEAAAVYPPENR